MRHEKTKTLPVRHKPPVIDPYAVLGLVLGAAMVLDLGLSGFTNAPQEGGAGRLVVAAQAIGAGSGQRPESEPW